MYHSIEQKNSRSSLFDSLESRRAELANSYKRLLRLEGASAELSVVLAELQSVRYQLRHRRDRDPVSGEYVLYG